MQFRSFLIVVVTICLVVHGQDARCRMTPAYPPPQTRNLKWFNVSLDSVASDRWTEITNYYKPGIQKLLDYEISNSKILQKLLVVLEKHENSVLARIPHDWSQEIVSIANIIERNVSEVIGYNLAYALFGYCTSIVAEDENGHIFHGRNLDFGNNRNYTDGSSELANILKSITFNVNFIKDGNILYKATQFAGFVGILTGVRANSLSVSVDTRFDDTFDSYLMAWVLNPKDTSQVLTFVSREILEYFPNFSEAVEYVLDTPEVGPAYIIMGGNQKGNGAVLTLGPDLTLTDYWDISHGLPYLNQTHSNNYSPWYVLETNYDHWKPPPPLDDRRYPAEECMMEIGSKGIDFYSLYNVLNGLPNRNRGTVYTTLMDPITGDLEGYQQFCEEIECKP